MNILIIGDEKAVQDNIVSMLKEEHCNTSIVNTLEETYTVLQNQNIDLLFCDSMFSGLNTILEKSSKGLLFNVYLVIYSKGCLSKSFVYSLNSSFFCVLAYPFRKDELAKLLSQAETKKMYDKDNALDFTSIKAESKSLVIPNDVNRLYMYINQLIFSLRHMYEAKVVSEIETGLYEIILNSIEHGNLNINFSEKEKAREEERYEKLLRERSQDPRYKDKKVKIEYTLDNDLVSYVVTDQGKGFDWKKLSLKSLDIVNLTRNGRGLILAKMLFDKVTYNPAGNVVTMCKSLKS